MYTVLLAVHSWLRWVVLLLGLLAVARAIAGRDGRAWTSSDDAGGRWFVMSLDVQLLIGLILYVGLSPFTMSGLQDMAQTMRNAPLRFVVVEHPFGMLVAIALAHVGRVKSRRAVEAARKHRAAALFFGVALLTMLGSIPWPFMSAGRPLFRGF
jgi:hypothetical protein